MCVILAKCCTLFSDAFTRISASCSIWLIQPMASSSCAVATTTALWAYGTSTAKQRQEMCSPNWPSIKLTLIVSTASVTMPSTRCWQQRPDNVIALLTRIWTIRLAIATTSNIGLSMARSNQKRQQVYKWRIASKSGNVSFSCISSSIIVFVCLCINEKKKRDEMKGQLLRLFVYSLF